MTTPVDNIKCDRREFLAVTSGAIAGVAATRAVAEPSRSSLAAASRQGLVVSEPEATDVGTEILATGGNAVDAVVAAALAAGVVNISKCGIGGYGGHMVIGLPGGKVTAIDFNSTAPAAARADMFPVDQDRNVRDNLNKRGWLAAGVPGTLAGLQLALENYGTLPLARVIQPAIKFAREGFPLPMSYTFWQDRSQPDSPRDVGSARLFSRNGKPLKQGDIFRNPDLADMLQQLAESGSVDLFYRGEIGRQIAEAFQKNGGIVTVEDMASYRAVEVEPLVLEWRGYEIATAPLTAGGLTVLQAIGALKAMDWVGMPESPARTQAWVEALRIAWGDRLRLLGDPMKVEVPVNRLLSEECARQSAERIKSAIAERRPVPVATDGQTAGGTMHVSATDARGMMASATFTHGNSFGAQVTVEGLGLILGHGMSRFDSVPGRANSIAPGKRPLNNMSPTIVRRGGRPILALGATGGRTIPNAVFQVLLGVIGREQSLAEAVSAPRWHTEGGPDIHAGAEVHGDDLGYLRERVGYKIKRPLPTSVYAVQFDAASRPGSPPLGIVHKQKD
jgi:gamma-glutamyltranspeptidase/glutathione hydrolase